MWTQVHSACLSAGRKLVKLRVDNIEGEQASRDKVFPYYAQSFSQAT